MASSLPDPSALDRVSRRIAISEEALMEAGGRWAKWRSAIRNGLDASKGAIAASQVQLRYTRIRRLVDEARRLVLTETAGVSPAVYAIDPHLITTYCSFWNKRYIDTLDFLQQEWEVGEDEERVKFLVYMLGAVLKLRNLVCLQAGREELSELLSYLLSLYETSEPSPRHLEEFEQAVDEITSISFHADRMGWSDEQVSEFIFTKFEALIAAGGIPQMSQRRSAQRLFSVLRQERLVSPIGGLRAQLGQEQGERLDRAESLYRHFLADGVRSDFARGELYDAYGAFVRTANFGERSNLLHENVADLRPGELANIKALFELRLWNACLAEAGLDAQLKYVTASHLIYNFLSAFAPDTALIDVIHPRHVFLFENRLTPENMERLRSVLLSPRAFLHALVTDSDIRTSELDNFEEKYAGVIREVRSTYAFAPVDGQADREALLRVIGDFVRSIEKSQPDAASRLRVKVARLSARLPDTADAVREAFSEAATKHSEDGFAAYRDFSASLSDLKSHRRLLVRSFGAQPSRGPDGSVPRLVCIPIRGGFRNIFKIYNTSVINKLHAKYAEVEGVLVSDLLADIEEAVLKDRETRSGELNSGEFEADALLNYMRAVYCVANREWTLSLSFTQAALERLKASERPDEPSKPQGNTPPGRRALMRQEVLLLQHFARRAIASREGLRNRQRWLRLAAYDLYQSASATVSIDDRESFETTFEPNSVRQALTAVSFVLEWLALKEARRQSGRSVGPGDNSTPLLPPAEGDEAWQGLSIATLTLEDFWRAEDAASLLVADLEILIDRVRANLDGVEQSAGGTTRHSLDFWRYILLKAMSLRLLVTVATSVDLLSGEAPPAPAGLVLAYRAALADHAAFIRRHDTSQKSPLAHENWESGTRQNPFANFVLEAHDWLTFHDHRNRDTSSAGAYLSLEELNGALHESGFPRLVSKRFIALHGRQVLPVLQDLTDRVARLSRYANAWPEARQTPVSGAGLVPGRVFDDDFPF